MYIKVHVYPGMKKERVKEVATHQYELVLKEPAARNAANERVREIIAIHYGVPPKQVRIVTGHRSPRKVLEIIGG